MMLETLHPQRTHPLSPADIRANLALWESAYYHSAQRHLPSLFQLHVLCYLNSIYSMRISLIHLHHLFHYMLNYLLYCLRHGQHIPTLLLLVNGNRLHSNYIQLNSMYHYLVGTAPQSSGSVESLML